MEHHPTNELHVVVHHIPGHIITTGNPVILINRLIVFDAYKVEFSGKLTISVGSCNYDLCIFCESTSRILNYRKSLGQSLIKDLFCPIEDCFFYLVYLIPDLFACLKIQLFDIGFELLNLGTLGSRILAYLLL